jgi:hypothetical protein
MVVEWAEWEQWADSLAPWQCLAEDLPLQPTQLLVSLQLLNKINPISSSNSNSIHLLVVWVAWVVLTHQ